MIKAFEAKKLMMEMKDKERSDEYIIDIIDSIIKEVIKLGMNRLVLTNDSPLFDAVKNSEIIRNKLIKDGYVIIFRKETEILEIQWGSSSLFKQGYYTEF